MDLHIDEFDLGGGRLESFVHVEGDAAVIAVAIHEDLDPPAREMRQVEAHGYAKSPPRRDRYCLRPRSMRDIDSRSVSAIRKVVDEQRPEWVAAVQDAVRISGDPRVIAAWVSPEIRIEAVVAILLNLTERGEGLPETH